MIGPSGVLHPTRRQTIPPEHESQLARRLTLEAYDVGQKYVTVRCSDGEGTRRLMNSTALLHGTVALRGPSAVPAGAVLTVTLEDVSKMDLMSETLGVHVIDRVEDLPVSFSIPYDPRLVVDSHTYGVRARVESEGALVFTTDRHHAVLTRGAPASAQLLLVPVATNGRP